MESTPSFAASAHTTVTHDQDSFDTNGTPPSKIQSINSSRVDIDSVDLIDIQQLNGRLANEQAKRHPSFYSSDVTLRNIVDTEESDVQEIVRALCLNWHEEAHIRPRTLGVVFRDLEVVGLGVSNTHQPTLGSLFSYKTIQARIRVTRHPPVRSIISGFEGVVKPGEMLLVLGRPGSGCTTFLKAVANMHEEYHAVNGELYYDSLSPADIKNHHRGDVQYCPEEDIHFPTLSVEQTLNFAAQMRAPHVRTGMSRSVYSNQMTDGLTTLFGLEQSRKTLVGNAAIHELSGGERKRVSIAEFFATRSCLGAWDNSTRGLDSRNALEYIRALRIATDTAQSTTIVSLYQASENVYRHFDKVCVIYEGKMAYFGPADQAKQYFIDMGYEPANRQITSDFLVSVTNPNGRIVRSAVTSLPRTAGEFDIYFKKSSFGIANRSEMANYELQFVGKPNHAWSYKKSAQAEHFKHTRPASPYMISIPMQLRAVMIRRVQILRGNMHAVCVDAFRFIFNAILVSSFYFNSSQATLPFSSRGGGIAFSVLSPALMAIAEIPALYVQRPIIHRHKIAALYHPFIETLALTLVDVSITSVARLLSGIIIYSMVGLQRTVGQFFIFYLFVFSTSITMKAWFRTIAVAFKSQVSAQTLAGISLLASSLYSGCLIPKPSMNNALKWITYINPLYYSFESILTNEFRTLNGKCSTLVPSGLGYENVSLANQVCTTVGSVSGSEFVNGARYTLLWFSPSYSHTWMNFGILMAFATGFVTLLLLFSEFNTSVATNPSVILFKQNSKSPAQTVEANDEESLHIERSITLSNDSSASARKEITEDPITTGIFLWQHINYTVPICGESDRKLLSDVTGYVEPGKLTALMGESGAGKTTLLNVLAQRVSIGIVTGDRFVDGQTLPKDFQAQTGYCQQMDTHLPTTTVREALLFSAQLRQPGEVPSEEKEAYAEKCLKMCGLEAYGDAIVGSLGVEHRKRTTIAVELAAKPTILFLDEPSTGLDSQSALSIMSLLRCLADNGQAILCTIHQPCAELFQVFDRLLLLRKGGQTVYFGDLGKNATTLINYFEHNGSRSCHPEENPAEFMLDVIGVEAKATSELDWYDIWVKSDESKRVQMKVDNIRAEARSRPPVLATLDREFATDWFYQVALLSKRNAQAYWRDPSYIMAKLKVNIIGGLMIGFTYWKANNTQQGTQNKIFAIFMTTVLRRAVLTEFLKVPFIATRNVYEFRERPSRMYSWTALITSQILIEVPWNIVGSSLLFLCWYWTVGFDSSRAGYSYLALGIIYPLYYTTFGQAVAAMSPNPQIAALLFSFLFPFVALSGVLRPFRFLGWWKWMYHLSPYMYLVEGLAGQALGHQELQCSAVEYVKLNPPSGMTCAQYMNNFITLAGGYLTNPDATSDCNFCSVRSSDKFLAVNWNIFYSHRWCNIGIVCAFIAFNIFCTYLFTYLFRIRKGSLVPSFKRSKSA